MPGGGKGGCRELLRWLVTSAAGGAGDSDCRGRLGLAEAGVCSWQFLISCLWWELVNVVMVGAIFVASVIR